MSRPVVTDKVRWEAVATDDRQVLAYKRSGGGKTVLVMLNFDSAPADVPLSRAAAGRVARLLAANRAVAARASVRLDPLGVFVAEVSD